MQNYHDLMADILENGDEILDERTGVGTYAIFGEQLKFDLKKGFPAITTKKLAWRAVVSELLWFLRGSSNVEELREILHGKEHREDFNKKTIWDANYLEQAQDLGYSKGEMGDIYGVQWRNFGRGEFYHMDSNGFGENHDVKGVDQVKEVLKEAAKNPSSRRLIVNAWNPRVIWDADHDDNFEAKKAALPPCHMMYQLNIINGRLDMLWYQRSADVGVGIPFNIASYALLLHIFTRILGLEVGVLTGSLGNCHIYKNHVDGVNEQLTRNHFNAPKLWINPDLKTLEDFEKASVDDFKLLDYECHPSIKMTMAV